MPSPFAQRLRELSVTLAAHPAVIDDHGSRSFAEVFEGALRVSRALARRAPSLEGRRIAILAAPGGAWIEVFFGVILGGGIAVPLSPLYPPAELAWLADDADADTAVISEDLEARGASLAAGRKVWRPEALTAQGERALNDDADPARTEADRARALEALDTLNALNADDAALLLYTSGTTGKPKGAVITHGNVATQAALVGEAWRFQPSDTLLHALPLHHLHGLGISLMTALLAGATARMLPRFDARRVWEEIAAAAGPERRCSVWMAVPTMYAKLIDAFDAATDADKERYAKGAAALRLSTSGSAALPVTLAERWRRLSGAIPLERFGMTEIGVGLSNPIEMEGRRPGYVGLPLRTVETKLVDEAGNEVETGPAELWVRGPSVFPRYWRRDDATRAAFSGDWFRTGDVAERAPDGYIKLLGRTSVDILKSGGYKLSALEIEEALRENQAIAEVAVVGIADEIWGERVVAVVVPASPDAIASGALSSESVRAAAKEILAPYKVPRDVIFADALPRNALGKVVKPDLVRWITDKRLRELQDSRG